MTFLSVLTAVAFVTAFVALLRARRLSKRLDRIAESYWELRYDYGQLRARVTRLEPADGSPAPEGAGPPPPAGSTAFVPLSSLKTR